MSLPRVAALLSVWIVLSARATDEKKPIAAISESAIPLLQEMSAASSRLKSLEASGTLTLVVEEPGHTSKRETAFSSMYRSPNLFRHEVESQEVLGSTGKKTYFYMPAKRTYEQADMPTAKAMLSDLPKEHARILFMQDPLVAMAFSMDAGADLRAMAADISKAADEVIGGKSHISLRIVLSASRSTIYLLLDPDTKLIRRARVDLRPALAEMGRPDIISATFTIDYGVLKTDAEVKEEQFAWVPPPGSKDLNAQAGLGNLMQDYSGDRAASMTGKPAPDFALTDLQGHAVKLSQLKGQVVVVDFWATWCPPCVRSMPVWDRIQKDLADKGVKVLAVNVREQKAEIEAFVRENSLGLTMLVDEAGKVAELYHATALPTTFIINREGVVQKVHVGFPPDGERTVRQDLAELVKGG